MLIITGPGRSGTSVLALFCRALGKDPGGSWHDAVDAGLEHQRVVQINDALLAEAMETGKTETTLTRYGDEMRQLDLAVVKDPRFTFHPTILTAWYSVRQDLRVLLTYRKPEHSIASRKRRAKQLLLWHRNSVDVIRTDLADTIELLLSRDIPFKLLLFPHFLDRYKQVYNAFQELGMEFDFEVGERAWNSVVRRDKVHFRSGDGNQAITNENN